MLENSLGTEKVRELHCHFSRIEFTKGGEKNTQAFHPQSPYRT